MGILKKIGEIFDLAFGGDEFVKTFKENSFWKPEDFAKTTARNMQRQTAIMEWQARHPGVAMTDRDIDEIDGVCRRHSYDCDGRRLS